MKDRRCFILAAAYLGGVGAVVGAAADRTVVLARPREPTNITILVGLSQIHKVDDLE